MESLTQSEVFVADPVTSRRAVRSARRAADKVCRNSRIIDPEKEEAIPRFKHRELSLGQLLGKGGFSDVYEISSIILSEDESSDNSDASMSIDDDNDSSLRYPRLKDCTDKHSMELKKKIFQRMLRSFLSEHCIREQTNTARYAIKHLSESCIADERQFRTGAADLTIEAKFLANISHPNIVKLRGLASTGPEGYLTGRNTGYFLILDRLYGTLEEKLGVWAEQNHNQASRYSGFFKRFDKKGDQRRMAMSAARMKAAFDIAGALGYLHSRGIIYRDLKPDNIGFDVRGDAKIFDFGLANELNGRQPNDDDTYKLSGKTGSLRYMAPEVARCQDYNLSADTYSYAILLWQMTSLEKPYNGMSPRDHSERVVYGSTRPELNPSWSEPLRKVLSDGWHPNLHKRPKMDHVYRIVRTEVAHLSGGESSVRDHGRRRSTYRLSFEKSFH